MQQGTPGTPAKERGGCLTILLVLYVIGAIYNLYGAATFGSTNDAFVAAGLNPLPSWYPIALVVLAIITLVGVYGLWSWKKWGAYAIIVDLVLNAILPPLVGLPIFTGLIGLVVGGALLWYVLKDKWALLEG